MRQLRQRININRFLEPLSFWETTEYVNHRLKVVGAKFDSCFEKNCKRLLHKMTRGVPRHINQLCDNALLICKALGYKKVNRKVLIKADRALRSDLLLTPNTPLIRRIPRVHSLIRRLALAGLPLIVLILAAILGYYGYLGANLHRVIDRGLAHLSSSSLETISSNAVTRSFVKEKLIVTDIKSPVSSNKQLQAKAMEGRFADFESGQTRPKSPVNDETESIKKSNLHDIGNTNSKHSSQPVVPDLVEKPQQSSLSSADNENVSEIVNEVEETPFESQLTEFTNALIDDNADSKNPGDQTSSTRKRVGPIEISIRQIEDLIVLNHWSATQADNTALVKQRNFTTPFRRIEVKKNESVGAIATRWFPDDPWSGVAAILSANRDIVDKNRIYPGQVLILPDLVSSRKAVEVVDNLYYAPYASFQSLKKLRNAMQWLSEKSIEYVVENQASFDGIPYFQINLKGYNQTNESKRAIESGNKSEQ
ncbi:MAG: LysM peptidoglycan-binding domain-containing protein [Desulforhabdus sp.]|nr:LysM peptidoglycan-binding domain-containing protein [Desulforhabdus sp.]